MVRNTSRVKWMLRAACGLLCIGTAARADLSGFGGIQTNGGATVSADNATLTLTDGAGSEARSAFFPTPVSGLDNFVATFTYTDVSIGGADGFAFVLQNDPRGAGALGDAGGAIGYGGVNKITPSVADAFNIYGNSRTGYSTGGSITTTRPGPVDITNGHAISVKLSFNGSILTETLRDTVTNASNVKIYSVNPADLGGATAYLGFTGGTGGLTSTQTIGNFSFVTGKAAATPAVLTPIAATGFNKDVVVEASATDDATTHFLGAVSATLDGGNTKTGATFYEKGLNGNAKGMPAAGVSVTSAANPNVSFAFQPYTGNNALQLDADSPTGTLTLAAPQAYTALAVFATTGSGGNVSPKMTLHFADGQPDLVTAYYAPDWFGNDQFALTDLNRMDPTNGTMDAQNNNPRIYQVVLDLVDLGVANHPISSIDFNYGGAGHTEVFAISGAAAVPEPAALGLLALGSLGLLARRRSSAR